MDSPKNAETLTVKEVREILQLGTNSAYNLLHSKAFPIKKIGHSYRIPSEPFYKWLRGEAGGSAKA
jgi:excisionase family DNA binding protein